MQLVFAIAFVAMLSYAGWTLYTEYSQSQATGWRRWLAAAEGSATILWSKAVMIFGALTGLLVQVSDYFNEPAISAAIQKYMTPQVWSAVVVMITVVTIWARKRKGSSDPV